MEISCVYIPEINEQEEDIFMAFHDIAKIEHIDFVVHNRYTRVVNGRSNSHDFDNENTIVTEYNPVIIIEYLFVSAELAIDEDVF